MKKKIDVYQNKSNYELQEDFIKVLKELGVISQESEYAPKKEGAIIIEFVED